MLLPFTILLLNLIFILQPGLPGYTYNICMVYILYTILQFRHVHHSYLVFLEKTELKKKNVSKFSHSEYFWLVSSLLSPPHELQLFLKAHLKKIIIINFFVLPPVGSLCTHLVWGFLNISLKKYSCCSHLYSYLFRTHYLYYHISELCICIHLDPYCSGMFLDTYPQPFFYFPCFLAEGSNMPLGNLWAPPN